MTIKKSLLTLLILYSMLILSACNDYDKIAFSGETENWLADYVFTHDGEIETEEITLTYLGEIDNLSSVEYLVRTNRGSFGQSTSFINPDGIFKKANEQFIQGDVAVDRDTKVTVSIEWNDHKDEIILSFDK